MFEKFLTENIEAFRQRYEGTFGFYRDEAKKRMLVKIVAIGSERCDFVNQEGVTYHMVPDSPRDIGFEFLPPKSAWYNTPEGAVFVQRIAQRQFSRGVTSKNLEAMLLHASGLVPRRIEFGLLSSIFEKPIHPRDAIKTLGTTEFGAAISSQFALDPRGNVWLLREPIGSYKRSGNTFDFKLNEADLWRTEITDALKIIGCTAEIK